MADRDIPISADMFATSIPVTGADFSIDTRPIIPRDENAMNHLKYGALGTVAAFVDTVGQSLGVFDQGAVQSSLEAVLPNSGTYYEANRAGLETASSIAGFLIPGMISAKLVQGGSWLARSAAAVAGENRIANGLLNTVFTSGKNTDALLQTVRARNLYLAERGVHNPGADVALQVAQRKALATGLLDRTKETLAFELGVYATMNDSETLYPTEMSTWEHIALNGGFAALPVAAEALFMKRAISRAIGEVADVKAAALNPAGIDMHNMISRPYQRDIAVTQMAMARDGLQTVRKDADNLYREQIDRQVLAEDGVIKKQFEGMAKDVFDRDLTSSHALSPAEYKTMQNAVEIDPLTYIGAKSVDPIPDTYKLGMEFDKAIDEKAIKLENKADELITKADNARTDEDRMKYLREISDIHEQAKGVKELERIVLSPDGRLTPLNQWKPQFYDVDHKITAIPRKGDDPKLYQFATNIADPMTGKALRKIGFTEDGFVIFPEKARKQDLNSFEFGAVQAQMRRAVDDFDPHSKVMFHIGQSDDMMRLDYIQELREKFGKSFDNRITMPAGMVADDIPSLLLNKQYDEYLRLRTRMDKQGGVDGSEGLYTPISVNNAGVRINLNDIVNSINLPKPPNAKAGIHPLTEIFEHARLQGDTKFIANSDEAAFRSLEDVQMQMQNAVTFPALLDPMATTLALRGEQLAMPRDAKSVVLTMQSPKIANPGRDFVEQAAALQRGQVMLTIAEAKKRGATLVDAVAQTIQGTNLAKTARSVETLSEGMQRGKQIVTSAAFNAEGIPALRAMEQVASITDKAAEKMIGDIFEPFNLTFAKISATNNKADLLQYNMYAQSNSFGWRQNGQIAKNANGTYSYGLDHSDFNKNQWRRLFNEEMPENAQLPTMVGKAAGQPLQISELAYQAVTGINTLGKQVLQNQNVLRQAAGVRPISQKEGWLPPKSLAGKEVEYIISNSGEVKQAVSGRTIEEVKRNVARELELLPEAERKNVKVVGQNSVKQYMDLQDKVFHGLIDYSDTMAQTGQSRGALGLRQLDVGPEVLKSHIGSLQGGFFSVANRTRTLMFEPELYQAKMAHGVANMRGAENSIWETYANAITGGFAMSQKSYVGKIYKPVETIYDSMVQAAYDRATSLFAKEPGTVSKAKDKEFKALEAQMGDFKPFEDVTEYVAATLKTPVPPSMRSHMGALSSFTTLLTLRLLDVSQGITNFAGYLGTITPVLSAIQKKAGEDVLQWSARVGAYGTSFETAGVVAFNPVRAAVSGAAFVFSEEGRAVAARAAKAGHFRADVAETVRALTAPQQGYWGQMVRGVTDKMSIIADKSEEITRQMAWMTAYKTGQDVLKITSEKDLFSFASQQADNVVGNYRPQNRPQIFQGAVGMPLGLFQTYAWNYMQRLLGYVENKQYKALAMQYGMQAFLFGGQSVPGFAQMNEMFMQGADGKINPVDGLRARFGNDAADVILHGSISSIPKLFGQDGVALYTRGDANMTRIPTLATMNNTPLYNLGRNVYEATDKTIDMFKNEGGYSTQRMTEILATHSISRPIRGMLELAAGVSVDKRGAVIADDLLNGLSISARLIGTKPMMEAKTTEAIAQLRGVEAAQRAKMQRLSEETQASVRGGSFDMGPALRRYVENGGNPAAFSRWFNGQMVKAQTPKGERELQNAMRDPTRGYDTMHLYNFGIGNVNPQ